MKARKALRQGPVVVRSDRARRRLRDPRDEVLGAEALEAPLPGPLLVLLSRLMRSERIEPGESEPSRNG